MKLLEHEAKHIISSFHIPTPKGIVVNPGDDLVDLPYPYVLKSQVLTGGRGKAGGIRIVKSESEARENISSLFNLSIKGLAPTCLLAEEKVDIAREMYVSVIINRSLAQIELLAHNEGGIEIESHDSQEFFRTPLTPETSEETGIRLAEFFSAPEQSFALQDLTQKLLSCVIASDATLLEINPLIITGDGKLVAGDCKMTLDNAAAFRHPEWDFVDPIVSSNFVTLNSSGNVATIANGAGLAMATVDAVIDAGLQPANFLDIGGGASRETVLDAFQHIVTFPYISAIIINIFAGITRCDEVAKAILDASSEIPNLPKLYIRLEGTNSEEARKLLEAKHIPLYRQLDSCINAAKEDISS